MRSTFFPELPPVGRGHRRGGAARRGLHLRLVARERLNGGVCWVHQLALGDDAGAVTLSGEGDYYEAAEPYEDDEPGEFGALRLRRTGD